MWYGSHLDMPRYTHLYNSAAHPSMGRVVPVKRGQTSLLSWQHLVDQTADLGGQSSAAAPDIGGRKWGWEGWTVGGGSGREEEREGKRGKEEGEMGR